MATLKNRYIRHRPVREEMMDDALFLIDEGGKAIHMLEGIGPGIWNMLAVPTSVSEAKNILKAAFPRVPPKRIARDAEALFADLEAFGLITYAN